MQINIFEGARRLAVLASVLAVVTAVALGSSVTSSAYGSYRIYSPRAQLIATPKQCDEPGSRLDVFSAETPKGRSATISLCLVSMAFPDKSGSVENLVPYRTNADGMVWGAQSYSPEVDSYLGEIRRDFTLPDDEGKKLDRQYDEGRNSQWLSIAAGLAVFLAVFWLGVAAIGWIVRGFAGIPRGKDARPKPEEK